MSVLDYSMMVEDSHIDTVVTEYRRRGPDTAINGRGERAADRRLPDRPARRRTVAGLFLLRSRRRRSARSAPTSSSTISRRRGASACRMSISAIGSRARARWPTRAPICRRSGSASTAGPASSATRDATPISSTTDWLDAHLGDADLRVIDASWHLPTTARKGDAEFRAGHIPGAVFFNIDTIADTSTGLPHMLPDRAAFAARDGRTWASATACDSSSTIRSGLFAAARVWWTLRAFGAKDVFDPRRRPAEMDAAKAARWRPARRIRRRRSSRRGSTNAMVAGLAEVKAALANGSAQVVDARPADRFEGRAQEPRPGLKSGHMPGALNLPYGEVLEHGQLKPKAAVARDIRRAWRRSRQAGDDDLRLRASARRSSRWRSRRPAASSRALRRLLGGMGRPRIAPSRPGRQGLSASLLVARSSGCRLRAKRSHPVSARSKANQHVRPAGGVDGSPRSA